MSKKKGIAVSVVLLLVLLIGGMLAYFTDTDTTTNVFTLGDKIEISLNESNWVATNGQGVHPGAQVAKNPVVKNDSTTTPAYVFLEVIVPTYTKSGNANTPVFTLDNVNSAWNLVSSTPNTTAKTITYVYSYGTASTMTSLAKGASTPALFTSVTVAPTMTAAEKETANPNPNIVVNAYGIQTDNLGTANTPALIYGLFTNP